MRFVPKSIVEPAWARHVTTIPPAAVWASETAIFALSAVAGFLLRFDFRLPSEHLSHLWYALPIWIAAKSAVFRLGKLDRGWWRYVSIGDILRLLLGNAAGSLIALLLITWLAPGGFPRTIYLLDLMLSFLGTAGVRVLFRAAAEARSGGGDRTGRKNSLIYGAGDAGVILLRELQNNPKLSYRVRGFLDDLPRKQGRRILGVPVLGGGGEAERLVKELGIESILIAIPSATAAQMTRILECCHGAGAECKTIPGLGDIVAEVGLAGQIREVALEDLLNRKPVRLETDRVRQVLRGKVVMVTGAAGSIGSELCRQIAAFEPAAIVGFEIAESPLFEIQQEMQRRFPHVPFRPEIGSVRHRARVDEVLRRHRPSAIYHAAAYKHVPLMEEHIFEAVENNVLGTYNTAASARDYGVEEFVLISTDKAVRPSSIMGATKRAAELLLNGFRGGATRYVAVRFGNVLGSAGSVVTIFKRQIAEGGPVTVTHPEMRRFFMTIPEACQLVLQAAEIGGDNQICVLDMGEQIRIVNLARTLIQLSGLRPGRDIEIQYTGIRPGEKLSEELGAMLDQTVPTAHGKIRICTGTAAAGDILRHVRTLRAICEERDAGRLVAALREIVSEYQPGSHLLNDIEAGERRLAAGSS